MLVTQKDNNLTDQDIEVIMWDVMAGGIDTTATTLEWLFYILGNEPETQRKMHEELDKVVGDRLPAWEDRDNLPYVNAVICELMRWKHFAPFGLPHMTLQDTEIGGYAIPKGAQILVNFHGSMMDPKAWREPEKWRPERFMEEEKHVSRGFLDGEMKPDKASYKFIPFGTGQRMCVGWGVGRCVLWLKVATHLHCFQMSHPTGKKYVMDEAFGVTVMPNDQKVKFTPRPAAKHLKSIEENLPSSVMQNL
jgi:cytochrome P450